MIYVLYGQPASGKTSLGLLLADHLNTPFFIDGDEFREIFSNVNFDKQGREQNIRNANAVVTYLNNKVKQEDWTAIYRRDSKNSLKGIPIRKATDILLCLVNPYKELRKELKETNKGEVIEIFLYSERALRKEYHVKDFEVGSPAISLNTDNDISSTFDSLLLSLKNFSFDSLLLSLKNF